MGSKTPGLNETEGPGVAPVYIPGKGSPGYGLDSQARNRNLGEEHSSLFCWEEERDLWI